MADSVFSLSYSFLHSLMSETQNTAILTWHQSSLEFLTKVGVCTETSHFVPKFRELMNSLKFIHVYLGCLMHLRIPSSDGIILRGKERSVETSE